MTLDKKGTRSIMLSDQRGQDASSRVLQIRPLGEISVGHFTQITLEPTLLTNFSYTTSQYPLSTTEYLSEEI